jgi:quercetin dioxygenase-like cupin family protein
VTSSGGFVVHAGGGKPVPGAGGFLLASSVDTGGAFSLLLSRSPAGDHVPRHVHHAVDEAFFVLSGQYRIECGDQTWTAAVDDFVFLPRGVAHSYDVVSGPARKLIIAVPGGIENFFDDLADGVDPTTLTHRHGVQFLD